MDPSTTESSPLLGTPSVKKPFYRARPLWLVPFAITAALVRGMTLAPRLEVVTQLSCLALHHHTLNHSQPSVSTPIHSLFTSLEPNGSTFPPSNIRTNPILIYSNYSDMRHSDEDDEDPRIIPSQQCMADPAVQAGAARIQTVMTTTMGLLSATTSGYWGHFSERHGRTRVLFLSTFGLFLTDLTFILVSTPGSPLASHGHKMLIIAPFIEGLLGGWSTLQSACLSYVSDCTSPGSRATIFSRFMGVFYLGLSVGPTIAGWIINNGIPGIDRIGTPTGQGKSVTEVFWLAICCSFINFLLAAIVFPESLSRESRATAAQQYHDSRASKGKARASEEAGGSLEGSVSTVKKGGILAGLLSPLSTFLPATITVVTGNGIRKKKDWSLTFLALALFMYMLSTGIFQTKYLYATHVYSWAADQLSYYISFVGGMRALTTLFFLPTVISLFKPKPQTPSTPIASTSAPGKRTKPKMTKQQLRREINFDLMLCRCSLCFDILGNFLISVLPAPSGNVHPMSPGTLHTTSTTKPVSTYRSAVSFVVASTFNSMSSGLVPAIQSLALCIMQARTLLQEEGDEEGRSSETGVVDGRSENVNLESNNEIGKLFGAFSTVQALGQMIIAPLVFGLVYSETVAQFPKTIFVVACSILVASLCSATLLRNPVRGEPDVKGKGNGQGRKRQSKHEEERRGRSRVSKDLFGGAYRPEDLEYEGGFQPDAAA
ncbi:hypothetical protein E1B28_011205 [Marasmius oreades]|uniref:MFS general substrate transporter n=1 Tax=Marasmius oreades TaxID=181124 RepID=A0A9P7RTK6_9AGAR|nr:uncharacterized protein E1B28_011205 [Marasmius oreades]KAG7089531.1 hypothetical protein E1B28_011205 [Marasmius oreades]